MAKSLRSKVKRSYRSKKRETGVYAASEAARLHRLNAKLKTVVDSAPPLPEDDEEETFEDVEGQQDPSGQDAMNEDASSLPQDSMQVDQSTESKRISTHGPRGSRREHWRLSKGMSAKPNSKGLNRQGGVAARRKAGRSKRRR